MFFRTIMDFFDTWKDKLNRKPLIVRGARQVGKTTVIKEFGKKFDQFIYLNLDLLADRRLFDAQLSVKELIQSILLHKNIARVTGESLLIFIDEIQSSGAAVSMLRYFYEDCPDIHVIAAGSLLETLIDTHISFPVGRVEYVYLYPVTFEEFLLASNEEILCNMLKSEVPSFAHNKLLALFHTYTMLGGMPEVVSSFVNHSDWVSLFGIYESLLLSYQDDVEKYAENKKQAQVIRHVIMHAPLQAGARIKFQNFGQSNYGSREVGEAMRILEKALLLKLVYPTTDLKPPFEADSKKSPRLQFLDTGIVNFSLGLHRERFQLKDLHNLYQGKIIEHIVGQQFLGSHVVHSNQLLFWVREKPQSNAEIDYVLPHGHQLIPIEVKAGKTGTLRSLHSFVDHSDEPIFAIRLYSGNCYREKIQTNAGKVFELLHLPYYLCGQLQRYIPLYTL
jgi:predicted AAA+ superfamily ATPase